MKINLKFNSKPAWELIVFTPLLEMRNLHTWESVQKGPLTERESCRGTSLVALAILSAMTHLDLYRLYRSSCTALLALFRSHSS